MNNMSMASVEKASASVMQAYEEMNNMARAFSEASMQSAAAMTKGWEEISRTASGMVQESVARSMEASKAMMGMKDVRQMVEAQQEMVKEFCDSWMAGTGKLGEISARISQEVAEPVSTQMNSAMGKIMAKARTAA
jgi:phasin family protein